MHEWQVYSCYHIHCFTLCILDEMDKNSPHELKGLVLEPLLLTFSL